MADVGVGRALTVRHTPSTDTLAPRPRSWQKPAGNSRVKRRRSVLSWMAAMLAMAWTMPVNMVLARFPPTAAGRCRRAGADCAIGAGRLYAGLFVLFVLFVPRCMAHRAAAVTAGRHGNRRQKKLRTTGADGPGAWAVKDKKQCPPIPRSAS